MPKTTEQIYKDLLAKGDQYQQQANDILSAYDNRPAFSYNANADSAYKAIRDQYVHQGQRAMQDTMGQAAGLTGGYGSTYAQAVGNQAYNEWLTKLSGVGVEMANQARAAYDAEGQRMLDRYGLALNAANQAYNQGRDALADQRYEQEQALANQRYDQEQARAQISAMIQMGKMPSDGLIAASGMNPADVKAMVSAYAAQLAAANAGKSGSGGSSSSKTPGSYTPKYDSGDEKPAADESDVFKGVQTDILYAAQVGNIAYAYDTLQKNADKLTPEQAKYVQEMMDRLFKQQKTQTNTQTNSGGKGWSRAGETRTQNFN